MSIPQGGIGSRLPRAPCSGGTGRRTLVPDDLPPHKEPQIQKVADQISMQWDIRFSAQVGNIDAGTPSWDKYPVDLGPHPHKKREVFVQREIPVVVFTHIVGWRRYHEVHRVVRQLGHGFGGRNQDGIKDPWWNLDLWAAGRIWSSLPVIQTP